MKFWSVRRKSLSSHVSLSLILSLAQACSAPVHSADSFRLASRISGPSRPLALSGKAVEKSSEAEEGDFEQIIDRLENLIKQYYPRVKLVRKKGSLAASYKLKPVISVYTQRSELMPQLDGLLCEVEVKEGKYAGREPIGSTVNQFYFSRVTYAPVSSDGKHHLLVRLSYPSNAPSQFIETFKDVFDRLVSNSETPVEPPAISKSSSEPERSNSAGRDKAEGVENPPQALSTPSNEIVSKTPSLSRPVAGRRLYLWKATRGDDVVYLLGTIHIAKESFYPLPQGVLDAFNESNYLLLEIDLSDSEFIKKSLEISEKVDGKLKAPERLRDKLSDRTKKAFEEYFEWSGESWEMYDQYKPWMAHTMLAGSIPRRGEILEYKGRYGIDNYLLKNALTNDMQVGGLEPPDREFFSRLDDNVQDTRLYTLLLDLKNREAEMKEMFDLWKAGDLQGMYDTDLREERKFPELRAYYKVLLDDRNVAMVKKLMEILKNDVGPFFVAVGSAHMPGEFGMVELLRKEGFVVEQMDDPRPSLAGLEKSITDDEANRFQFAPGPLLAERRRLYKAIQGSAEKGIGTQGYMTSFKFLESIVKSGAAEDKIDSEINRVERALSKQLEPLAPQVVSPYCVEIERLLASQLKSSDVPSEGVRLVCTVYSDGSVKGLRKSRFEKGAASSVNAAIARVRAVGKLPSPPKSPLRLSIIASSNPSSVEVWHRAAMDESEIADDMRARIRKQLDFNMFPSGTTRADIEFRVSRSGRIDRVRLKKPSGVDAVDAALVRAVQAASPVKRLPDGYRKYLKVEFDFSVTVRR